MDDSHPLSRQTRLPEVGARGQARIDAAALELAMGPGAAVELAYLCRAGVGRITLSSHNARPELPHASSFRHAAAREFAAGSWRALDQLRTLLALKSP